MYLDIRLRFIDRLILPAVNHVNSENWRHRPSLTEYRNGVRAPLYECLSLTERLQSVDLSSLGRISQVNFDFTWGLDGSGEHSNYNQLSKVHYTTKQVMSVCFSVKKIAIEDRSGKRVTWSSSTEGTNKPQNVRPLLLFPEKETKELLQDIVPKVEKEITQIKKESVKITMKEDVEVVASCDNGNLSMADGKMVNVLLQQGGSYCTMCSKSDGDCHNPSVIVDL